MSELSGPCDCLQEFIFRGGNDYELEYQFSLAVANCRLSNPGYHGLCVESKDWPTRERVMVLLQKPDLPGAENRYQHALHMLMDTVDDNRREAAECMIRCYLADAAEAVLNHG